MIVYYLAISVNDELSKVPWNLTCSLVLFIVQWTVSAQILIEWMSVFAIHVDLGEELEFRIECFSGELFDFSFCSRFLAIKLVAREAKDLETLSAELLVKLHCFGVVLLCQSSVSCNIHDHDTFLSFNSLLKRFNHLSVYVLCSNLPR